MLAAPGQSPAVLVPPSALHAPVEMQVPLKLSTLHVAGALGLVQHCKGVRSDISPIYAEE